MEGLIFGILRYRTWAIEDHVPRGAWLPEYRSGQYGEDVVYFRC